MIEKIKGLSVQGRCFVDKTNFKFYKNNSDRISVIYGKNGSGKSTITNAIYSITNKQDFSDISAQFLDELDKPIEGIGKDKISVFNERYIDENVKIDGDGLGAIILLGNQVDLQAEIDKYTDLEKEFSEEVEKADVKLREMSKKENISSPEYHLLTIKKNLQEYWAVKDAKIKGNKVNSRVTDSIINEICKLSVTENIQELQQKYESEKELLKKISNSDNQIPQNIKKVVIEKGFDEILCNLLCKKIEKPVLSEREKLILQTIMEGNQGFLESAMEKFSNEDTHICPYCYRDIDENYKQELIKNINRVLNKDVEIYREELKSVKLPSFEKNYNDYINIDSYLVNEITKQNQKCIELLDKYKQYIDKKDNNVYAPLTILNHRLENEVKNLNDLLTKLENKIYEFTNAIKRGKEIQKNLLDLNKKIAHLQVVETYKNYLKQSEEMKGLKEDLEQKRDKHKKIKEHLDSLKQKKSDMSLAINTINNALNYVFFSKERLSIELKNDKYYLKSRGKNVLPKDISMGERNIIALCYFFTQMFSNQDIKNLYKYEQLVVIDDPVSSFDFENRVGIITYIRYEINKIIKGNNNSKILIFSHDLATIYDLQKATGEICKSIGKNKHGVKVTSSIMKLDNKKLDDFKKNAGEYRELLLNVYAYANGTFNGDEITIGNSMRRVLEAFSTFNYCKGVQDVLISPNVLQALGNKSLYFENLMSRLVLHGESHFEEQIYNLHDDANFYQFISNEEKKRTAKDILCFIFILNKYHIKSYFDENQKAIKNIELWVNKIPNNSEFEIDELNKEISPKRKIKLFDISLSAGTGNHIFDNVEYQEYETDCEDCDFALKISGDSMQPTIPDSSIVLLKRSIEIKAEDIGAFYLNGEVFCKRIKKEGDFILLCSDNTKYKPIKVKEYDTFETYGKVVKIVK